MDYGVFGVYAFLFAALYFEVYIFMSFLEKRPSGKTAVPPTRYPSVSIIVPCWNEGRTIAGTLRSLLALEYPKDKLKIIVVNDGSTDNTLEALAPFRDNSQIEVLSREKGGEGKHVPLNLGIEKATGELIGCLDADSFVAPDALVESVKKFEENEKTMAVIPAMVVNRPRNLLELMQATEYTFGVFYKKMFSNLGGLYVLPGPFSLYRRDVFEKIGIFHRAHNTEDMEMAFRMHANGMRIENAHTALVYTNVPKTLRTLIKQRTRWQQGFLQNSLDYRYMILNPRFGNFGMVVLPLALTTLAGVFYILCYTLFRIISSAVQDFSAFLRTGIPLHFPTIQLSWFYLDTSMLNFLVVATLLMTLTAIVLGWRITGSKNLNIASIISYFTFYGLVVPVWLTRAVWGTIRAKDTTWR